MKMAIIGSGPLAILAAKHFDEMGAEVVLFQRSPMGGKLRMLSECFPDFKINYKGLELKAVDFFEKIIAPIAQALESNVLIKKGDVLRVHKRFLHENESIPHHTRMHDLFRVVYSQNPKDAILKQFEEKPQFFAGLSEEIIQSLHKPIESFEDFDLVIEASGAGSIPCPAGAGGSLALNENNLKESAPLFYEQEIFTKLEMTNKKKIIFVGEGETLKLGFLKLKDWLFADACHEIYWVTYKTLDKTSNYSWVDFEFENLLKKCEEKFSHDKNEFEKKIFKWRELEDYEKAKISAPKEPLPSIRIYEGYDLTSIDQLLDQTEIFATIESPDFRDHASKKHEIITLSADAICIARGMKYSSMMPTGELGFYKIMESDINLALEKINLIEKEIGNFFKKTS